MVSAWEGEETEGQKETRRWEETMETMTLAIIFYLYFPYILYIFNVKFLNGLGPQRIGIYYVKSLLLMFFS